jgi:general secretion pathway protein I
MRQRGFGLLEAIVALALLTGLGLTVFAWINANLASVTRLRGYDEEVRLGFLAAEWARTVNPAQRGQGEVALDAVTRIRWESRLLGAMTTGAPFPGGTSTPFRLGRYAVRVHASRADLPRPVEVELVLVGFERETVVQEGK